MLQDYWGGRVRALDAQREQLARELHEFRLAATAPAPAPAPASASGSASASAPRASGDADKVTSAPADAPSLPLEDSPAERLRVRCRIHFQSASSIAANPEVIAKRDHLRADACMTASPNS